MNRLISKYAMGMSALCLSSFLGSVYACKAAEVDERAAILDLYQRVFRVEADLTSEDCRSASAINNLLHVVVSELEDQAEKATEANQTDRVKTLVGLTESFREGARSYGAWLDMLDAVRMRRAKDNPLLAQDLLSELQSRIASLKESVKTFPDSGKLKAMLEKGEAALREAPKPRKIAAQSSKTIEEILGR